MENQEQQDYNRIAEAIFYLKHNFKDQPTLEEVAEKVHLSPFHFQRLFSKWAGVSPKQFLQYININYARSLLKDHQRSLFDVASETGLSGTGRLHDLFVKIESMTPGEYKNGGKSLSINYSFQRSPFGEIIIASTSKGICHMAFIEEKQMALEQLQKSYPHALLQFQPDDYHKQALNFYSFSDDTRKEIRLHLKGTDFQLKVWEALLQIPMGKLSTYGEIAKKVNQHNASRAVGTAIGKNPVALLIPCHRVIQSTGLLGGYMWGPTRKAAIIGWEAAQINQLK